MKIEKIARPKNQMIRDLHKKQVKIKLKRSLQEGLIGDLIPNMRGNWPFWPSREEK